jgi:predicted DNA-binding transcriptional regulator AlpA
MTEPSPTNGPYQLINEKTAAEILNISPDTLRRLGRRGEGPRRIKLSPRRVGYRIRDLGTWLDEQSRHTKSEAKSRATTRKQIQKQKTKTA